MVSLKKYQCRIQKLMNKHACQTEAKIKQSVLTENIEAKSPRELEAALAVRVAQHLLVPLAPHKTFRIDSYPGLELTGGCSGEHPMNWDKGDTSFGCRKGWHGRADILIGDEIPVTVVETGGDVGDPGGDVGDHDCVSVSSDSSVEIKKGEDFTPSSLSQITAQTIVNSFVQRRKNPESVNSMVPGIGICSKKLILSMYDCVDDILVSTGPIDLHAQLGSYCNLNLRAIIILWLALNHRLFGNKTPKQYTKYTSDFHKVLSPGQLEAYMNESEQPFNERFDENYPDKYFNDLSEEASCYFDDILQHMTSQISSISLK